MSISFNALPLPPYRPVNAPVPVPPPLPVGPLTPLTRPVVAPITLAVSAPPGLIPNLLTCAGALCGLAIGATVMSGTLAVGGMIGFGPVVGGTLTVLSIVAGSFAGNRIGDALERMFLHQYTPRPPTAANMIGATGAALLTMAVGALFPLEAYPLVCTAAFLNALGGGAAFQALGSKLFAP